MTHQEVCPKCGGKGVVFSELCDSEGNPLEDMEECNECDGCGIIEVGTIDGRDFGLPQYRRPEISRIFARGK